jgi:hypothetical protein
MKIFYIFFITLILFSCNNKQRVSQNGYIGDTNKNKSEENFIISNNEKKNNYITINEKLNINIPEIGEKPYSSLFTFEKIDLVDDRYIYGYEELVERLNNSYLMIPLYPSKDGEAIVFDNTGILKIYMEFFGIIPDIGDGTMFKKFVVIGKFENDYNNEYYASKHFDNEIIVTFDNYSRYEDSKQFSYKFYAYYKKIE